MAESWMTCADKLGRRISVAEALASNAEGVNYDAFDRLNVVEKKRHLTELYESVELTRLHFVQLVEVLMRRQVGDRYER
jgi:hypothetical protein